MQSHDNYAEQKRQAPLHLQKNPKSKPAFHDGLQLEKFPGKTGKQQARFEFNWATVNALINHGLHATHFVDLRRNMSVE